MSGLLAMNTQCHPRSMTILFVRIRVRSGRCVVSFQVVFSELSPWNNFVNKYTKRKPSLNIRMQQLLSGTISRPCFDGNPRDKIGNRRRIFYSEKSNFPHTVFNYFANCNAIFHLCVSKVLQCYHDLTRNASIAKHSLHLDDQTCE